LAWKKRNSMADPTSSTKLVFFFPKHIGEQKK
jgi:hypothetical protein